MDLMSWMFGKKNDPISRAIEDAISHLEEKDFDAAIRVLEENALSRDPGHRRALLHLGVARMLKGDYDAAEALLRPLAKSRTLDSESAAAKIALEKIAKERKKAEKA